MFTIVKTENSNPYFFMINLNRLHFRSLHWVFIHSLGKHLNECNYVHCNESIYLIFEKRNKSFNTSIKGDPAPVHLTRAPCSKIFKGLFLKNFGPQICDIL